MDKLFSRNKEVLFYDEIFKGDFLLKLIEFRGL